MPSDSITLREFLKRQQLMRNPYALDPVAQSILFRKSDTPLLTTDFFYATYGAKVWDALNTQTRFWNALRKVPWGTDTGWRNRTGRNNQTQGLVEDGTLPDRKKQTYLKINADPKIIVTPFAVTVKAQWMANLSGGIGDALATEQEFASSDHVKWVNQELVRNATGVVTTSGASATGVVKPAGAFQPGDKVRTTTAANGVQTLTVVTHDATTGVLTYTGTGTLLDGNAVSVFSRLGPHSIDDLIEQDGRTMPGANSSNVLAYDLTTRTAGTYASGIVLDNGGLLRNVSTALIDKAIRNVRDAGGEPDLILTGTDMVDGISNLLQANQQFMGYDDFKVKVGSEQTLPGTNAGFQLATYKGVPIFHDPDCAKSYTEAGVLGGSNIYVLDTRELEVAVAQQPTYSEERTFRTSLVINGLYWSMMEIRSRQLNHQAKITDLNAIA